MKFANPWEGSAGQLVGNLERMFDSKNPDAEEVLPAAVSLLLRLIEENHPEEGCSAVTMRFDGSRAGRKVELVSVEDRAGRLLQLAHWRAEWQVEAFLLRACTVYLDRHLPGWRAEGGARGYLTIWVERESRERWALTPRGSAVVRLPRAAVREFPLQGTSPIG